MMTELKKVMAVVRPEAERAMSGGWFTKQKGDGGRYEPEAKKVDGGGVSHNQKRRRAVVGTISEREKAGKWR